MKKIGILITGKMYTGKTALADHLVGQGYTKFSMAKSLKQLAGNHYNKGEYILKSEYYPVYDKALGKWIEKQGRTLLQELSEAIKVIDYSWFYAETAIEVAASNKEYFVIDDCRFREEYDYFKDTFDEIKLIYLTADVETQLDRAIRRDGVTPTDMQLNAVSEKCDWARDVADYRVYNNSFSLETFLGLFDNIK